MYFLKPKGYSVTAERVLVNFDGSASGVTAKGPWIRIRYRKDKYSRSGIRFDKNNHFHEGPQNKVYSGDFEFEQPEEFIMKLLDSAVNVRQ